MDFQFTSQLGTIMVKCSMGHEAVANWFNSEVRSNSDKIQYALHQIQTLKPQQELTLIGHEYTLFINQQEIMVRANNLTIESEQPLEDDFHYYDEESIAFCGTDDFIHFLQSYLDFIQQ
ncbi:MAG: YacL family protein [Pasteurella oralis]|uniref:YacL family protein n=1 Tax=Pasteurella oralis TaxID=1071947 RepID=UPI002705D932|nr:YacL family protein [Pasteurella oralis]